MSQMFLPFFLSLFYQALQKRQLHLFLLRNRQQDFFSGKQKKMRILRCCIHALQLSRHHATVTLESPRHPQREKTTRVRDKDCIKNRVKRAKIVRFTLC